MFGQSSSQSLFGFGQSSSCSSLFGFSSQQPLFGQSSQSLFGSSQPLFGQSSSTSLFGGFGVSQPQQASQSFLFGQSSSAPSIFGYQSSTSLWGQTTSILGQPQGQQQMQFQPSSFTIQLSTGTTLSTNQNQPIAYETKWEEISENGRKFLLELEKVLQEYKLQHQQIKQDKRLNASVSGKEGERETDVRKEMDQILTEISLIFKECGMQGVNNQIC
eukprot:TRINITY_DN35375_c1_g1_i2.p1 TRINITY_DN35375_c1_g1~~TRINITY_DN35375_c1_g1_i2.p1  ORF type:complete len:226 (+),score=12.24 TRINITY_DN35375_c1_g1_i2:30-680(+)